MSFRMDSQVAEGITIIGDRNTLAQVQTNAKGSQISRSQVAKGITVKGSDNVMSQRQGQEGLEVEDDINENPLEIKVKKDNPFSGPKFYNMVNNPRGRVLIINIKTFDMKPESERHGSEKDVENLWELFQQMGGYEIIIQPNLTAYQIRDTVREFSKQDFSQMDISVVIIMSHGIDGGIIDGSDSQPIRESEILQMFSEENANSLKGKPKVFLFAACRGNTSTDGHIDAQVMRKGGTSTMTDFFILRGTAPGHTATRDLNHGTFFIGAFCTAMMKNSCDTHLVKLVPIMQNIVKSKSGNQQIFLESDAKKKLYFNPF